MAVLRGPGPTLATEGVGMTPAQIIEALNALDTDPVFLFNGMQLCYWCQDPVDMGFKHSEDCPWNALRRRFKKLNQPPLPELVDLPSGPGIEICERL